MNKIVFTPDNPQGVISDLTAEEVAEIETIREAYNTELAEIEAEKTQKATDQANGNQKLLDLGLTQAEATALTGYTPPEE